MNQNQQPNGKNKGITPLPMKARMPKRWILAKSKYGHTRQQFDNENVEGQFMHLLYKVKQLLKGSQQVVFDRDYRHCNAENAFAMHAFISSDVYLYLECDFCYNYQIEYAFNSCPCEAEIGKLLNVYSLTRRVKEVSLQPSFTAFYDKVITIQEKRYLRAL